MARERREWMEEKSAIKNSWISSPPLLINGQSTLSDLSSVILVKNVGKASDNLLHFSNKRVTL